MFPFSDQGPITPGEVRRFLNARLYLTATVYESSSGRFYVRVLNYMKQKLIGEPVWFDGLEKASAYAKMLIDEWVVA